MMSNVIKIPTYAPGYFGEMTVQVNGEPCSRFVGMKGESATYRIECSKPISDRFAVPLQGLFGAQGKTLMFEFVDGVAEREVVFDVSGEWEVKESQINVHLPENSQFKFAGLFISIAE